MCNFSVLLRWLINVPQYTFTFFTRLFRNRIACNITWRLKQLCHKEFWFITWHLHFFQMLLINVCPMVVAIKIFFFINENRPVWNSLFICHLYFLCAPWHPQCKTHFTIQFKKTQQNVIHFNKYRYLQYIQHKTILNISSLLYTLR